MDGRKEENCSVKVAEDDSVSRRRLGVAWF